mmetsp:Transcript_10712/g.30608  ORF Transcript_10712/g.30608 Transcript_10712/m.30608 type:complete len:85 (+) Transcript_10712:94-348(+)
MRNGFLVYTSVADEDTSGARETIFLWAARIGLSRSTTVKPWWFRSHHSIEKLMHDGEAALQYKRNDAKRKTMLHHNVARDASQP